MGRSERQVVVRELFQLGFSLTDIAEATKISQATINSDTRAMGGAKAFPNRPKYHHMTHKGTLRRHAFKRYAEIYVAMRETAKADRDPAMLSLHDILADWLNIPVFKGVVYGVELAMHKLRTPQFPPEKMGYWLLTRVLFIEDYESETPPMLGISDFWRGYLEGIATGTIELPKYFFEDVADKIIAQQRASIAPIWGDEAYDIIEKKIQLLPERKERIIRARLGIGQKQQTREEVAETMGVTHGRIGQLENMAFEQLRRSFEGLQNLVRIAPVP